MSVKSYDPAQVKIIIAGIPIDGGFAAGTFINVSRRNPSYNLTVGADGEQVRSKSNDQSATAELTLLQSSLANDALSGLSIQDELSGDGVGAFLLKDLSGRTILESEACWVEKPADTEFAGDISERKWTIAIGRLIPFIGGQNTVG